MSNLSTRISKKSFVACNTSIETGGNYMAVKEQIKKKPDKKKPAENKTKKEKKSYS